MNGYRDFIPGFGDQMEAVAEPTLDLLPRFAGASIDTHGQVCRYLVKDFGTSQSPKSTRQRDSRYCPDR
ncbi:MAG: hypothetical protein AB2814_02145, partial [Candidatus Sedimenticola endophacoides]